MAHDNCGSLCIDNFIGRDCVIGVNGIVMTGVKRGDEVVIGSGSVVTKDVPSHSIAVGNPAKVIKTDVSVYNGKLLNK